MDAEQEASEHDASLAACLEATPAHGECRMFRALFEGRDFAPVAALILRIPLGGDLYQTVVERVTEGVVQQASPLIASVLLDPVSVAVWLGMKMDHLGTTRWWRDRHGEPQYLANVAWTQAMQEQQQARQQANTNRLTVARSPLH